jgi:hypothetical protein
MAYSLPSFSAAANYAASYRPIFDGKTLADGYKNIKSEEGVNAMQNALNADFLAKVGMAKSALGEFGAMKRQELVADVARERLEAELKISDQRRSDSKKAALISLLGGGLGDVVGKQLGGGDLLNLLAGTNTLSDNEITKDRIRSGNLGIDFKGTLNDGVKNLVTDTGMTVDPSKVVVKQQLQAPPKLEVKREPINQLELIQQLLKQGTPSQ